MLQALLQRIRSSDSLPSLPTVAAQVLQLAREPEVSLEQLTAVIQNDPAMTAKILKIVNSPLFGMSREIGSLKRAVTLLGLRRVTIMALSFSLVDSIKGLEDSDFDLYGFWRRSLSTAIASRLIAEAVAPELAEEAFAAGLLSDIGIVVAWRCTPDLYQPVLHAWTGSNSLIQDLEMQHCGCTHARVGRELLRIWGLPDLLCNAVGSHHGEGLDHAEGVTHCMGAILHSAAIIADLFCGSINPDQLELIRQHCVSETGIAPDRLDQCLEGIDERVRQTAATLSVQVGTTLHYTQLQADAAMMMADLSIQAETERDQADRRAQQARTEANRLNQERAALLEAASTDALTNLPNRTAFDRKLAEELKHARQHNQPVGLIFMDLDRFKDLNDRFGHQAGDQVLRCVGGRLNDVVKGVGFAARYGGEEFVIFMGCQLAEVQATAEAIRKRIAGRPVEYDGRELRVSASLGVACVEAPCQALTGEQLIAQADQQLYRAKRAGRNRVSVIQLDAIVTSA